MTDIEKLLIAYASWCNDDNNELSCKSPSLMLMKSAPKQCKDSVKPSNRSVVMFITDSEALVVDRAMQELMCHSVHLHSILYYHFIKNYSVDYIAKHYWSKFEYPKGDKVATNYHVKPLLNRAIGIIEGILIKDIA